MNLAEEEARREMEEARRKAEGAAGNQRGSNWPAGNEGIDEGERYFIFYFIFNSNNYDIFIQRY